MFHPDVGLYTIWTWCKYQVAPELSCVHKDVFESQTPDMFYIPCTTMVTGYKWQRQKQLDSHRSGSGDSFSKSSVFASLVGGDSDLMLSVNSRMLHKYTCEAPVLTSDCSSPSALIKLCFSDSRTFTASDRGWKSTAASDVWGSVIKYSRLISSHNPNRNILIYIFFYNITLLEWHFITQGDSNFKWLKGYAMVSSGEEWGHMKPQKLWGTVTSSGFQHV